MTIIVEIERYIPPRFFVSANSENNEISRSEQLAKAVLRTIFGYREDQIQKGNPNNNKPDWIVGNFLGYEVTFASNRASNSIYATKMGEFNIHDLEHEIFTQIDASIVEKSKKVQSGNYSGVKETILFVICMEPIILWYGYLYGFDYPSELRRRDAFFENIYNDYINSKVFTNVFLLQLTEFKTYVLYDLRNFIKKPKDCITEIGISRLNMLPHCKVLNVTDNGNSILQGYPLIEYRYQTITGVEKNHERFF